MKFIIAFLIFCSMQNQLVQSETIDDVLENFRPTFDEMYGILNKLTRTLFTYAEEKVLEFKAKIDEQADLNEQEVSAAEEDINNSEEKILEELGLVGQAHVIGDCIEKMNNQFTYAVSSTYLTTAATTYMRDTVFELVKNTLERFNHTQHVRRLLIEETKYKCKAASSIPQEMETCLYNEILFQHKPALAELVKDMRATQQEANEIILAEWFINAVGSTFTKFAVHDHKHLLLSEFRSCCYKVVGKN